MNWVKISVFLIVLGVCQTGASELVQAKKVTPTSKPQIQLSFAPLVKKAAPAVVNIYTRKRVRNRQRVTLFDDPFFKRFFGDDFSNQIQPRERFQNSLGSGVIVKAEGLVVTNNHVIEGADEIKVVLSDRREFDAELIATDPKTDIAILQIRGKNTALPFLPIRDSDEVEIGDLVLAIGNPFGVGQTVTSGIVSALARTKIGSSDLNFFIQTDAAINPGNSGGALVSMDGKLVGINTAIFSKSGGSHGIGFAIPSTMVRAIVNGISADGKLVRSWLGATGQPVNQDIATNLSLKRPSGVLINRIHKFGSAESAGLKIGDVILSVNGHEVNDPNSLKFRIATLSPGEVGRLKLWRNKRVKDLKVTLKPAPELPSRDIHTLQGRQPLSGAVVANMSPLLAEELSFDPYTDGVTILNVARGSSAARFGFSPGDIIREINRRSPSDVRQMIRLLETAKGGWNIVIERNGKSLNLTINDN